MDRNGMKWIRAREPYVGIVSSPVGLAHLGDDEDVDHVDRRSDHGREDQEGLAGPDRFGEFDEATKK